MSGMIEARILGSTGGAIPLTTKGDLFTWDTAAQRLPVGSDGQLLSSDSSQATGLKWITASGTGTVTSAGVVTDSTTDAIFANTTHVITGSPITAAGNMTLTFKTQSANLVLAGPTTGAAAAPAYRSLVGADLPLPGAATLGGVFSKAAVSNQFLTAIVAADGSVTSAQPAFSNISGTVSAAQLPNPSSSTLGGIQSAAAVSHQWINSISTSGVPALSQPAVADVTGAAPLASPTFTGQVNFSNYHMEPSEANAGNSSTTLTVDLSTGSAQKVTMTGNCTFTFTNPVTGGTYVFRLVQDATGSRTATWPGTVKWPAATAPTLTTTAAHMDLISFYWDGTDYYGTSSLNYTP